MFGFFGLMAVLLALNFMVSYWISWDLQDKESLSPFATNARRDFVALVGKWRDGVKRWRPALQAYAKQNPAKATH